MSERIIVASNIIFSNKYESIFDDIIARFMFFEKRHNKIFINHEFAHEKSIFKINKTEKSFQLDVSSIAPRANQLKGRNTLTNQRASSKDMKTFLTSFFLNFIFPSSFL